MIRTKQTKTIACDTPACAASITLDTSRDSVIRLQARIEGWVRRRGEFGNMEDRCPAHTENQRS